MVFPSPSFSLSKEHIMKKIIPLLLVIFMVGCSCSSNNQTPLSDKEKSSCVAICDRSLNNCVKTLGEESKTQCHSTYHSVCMPGCRNRSE